MYFLMLIIASKVLELVKEMLWFLFYSYHINNHMSILLFVDVEK